MTDTPPDWAFLRAEDLRNKRGFTYLDAFAAYIAEHERPPVDRKLLCAWEAEASMFPPVTKQDVAIRAIELWEEGFGK
jgi:hypothetical protein